MKQKLSKGSLILLSGFFFALACKKSVDQPTQNTTTANQQNSTNAIPGIPYPVTPVPECDYAPNYGDSIVFPQPSSGDYYVYPQNNQGVSGTYLSWPGGLAMDPSTGAIDLTQSETGQRYSVAFVKSGTTDTCLSQLIVGGAAYMDSVYVLSESDTTSKPYFNANPYGPPVCVGTQGKGCKFDYNNFAHNQGIEIDQKTGYIDLKKTMQKSPFGILPINGTTVYTTIYYQLNDNSNFADQKIQLKMVYYNRVSDIPGNLLSSISNTLMNIFNDLLISKSPASTRPPLIIIVRNR